jgi:hypothetical protein
MTGTTAFLPLAGNVAFREVTVVTVHSDQTCDVMPRRGMIRPEYFSVPCEHLSLDRPSGAPII